MRIFRISSNEIQREEVSYSISVIRVCECMIFLFYLNGLCIVKEGHQFHVLGFTMELRAIAAILK